METDNKRFREDLGLWETEHSFLGIFKKYTYSLHAAKGMDKIIVDTTYYFLKKNHYDAIYFKPKFNK